MVTPTYTSVVKVRALIGIQSGTADPSNAEIEEIINRKEDYIDKKTGHAWRTLTVTDEFVNPSTGFSYGTGVRFDLKHRNLKAFVSGTDKIEVWDGASDVDFVANRTEGRNNDWWVNLVEGVVYIKTHTRFFPDGVKFTYRYGDSTVDGTVEDIVTKMAAIDIINSPEFEAAKFTDDGQGGTPPRSTVVDSWKEDITEFFEQIKETGVL